MTWWTATHPVLQWGRGPKAAETEAFAEVLRLRMAPSMGPRPEGRGNPGPDCRRSRRSPTFNGAAARRPRKHSIIGAVRIAVAGLQWGRGPKAAETKVAHHLARGVGRPSMGPRPEGRGNRAIHSPISPAPLPFNGAAARRPRKPPAPTRQPPAYDVLQWGRGPKAAETAVSDLAQHVKDVPSMGPRPEGRGNAIAVWSPESTAFDLQWGRGPKAAETHFSWALFKEAVRLQWGRGPKAAETDQGKVILGTDCILQWGRGPKAAETRGTLGEWELAGGPSMGPRPEGRGNDLHLRGARRGNDPLQWGRGPKAAETMADTSVTVYTAALQWGRGPKAAETARARCLRPRGSSFNGAAARRPRKRLCRTRPRLRASTFNGAAARRPRKLQRRAR